MIETAIRECFKETNVVITPADMRRQLTAFSYEFLTPSDKLVRKTIVPFLFEIADFGNPAPKEKRVISVRWMEVADFFAKLFLRKRKIGRKRDLTVRRLFV